nr:hypothetical protein [Tanacetum cinerariifolium]
DDDEESSTPLRDIIISELPLCIAITPVLSNKETKDSLIIGDEHLDTIPEKESDEFIKSSVENLVPNPSESEDLSNIGSECDMAVCNDFITFYNLLFDADDNFSSSDDKSFSDEDVPKEIYSNPLFDEEIISIKIDPHHFNAESDLIEYLLNQDSLIISSFKIDSLLDEFVGELIFLKSIPPGIDEADCIENDDYDSEGDILFLEELLSNDSFLLPEMSHFILIFHHPLVLLRNHQMMMKFTLSLIREFLLSKWWMVFLKFMFLCLDFYPPNAPLLQMRRNLLVSYLIGALKLSSFLLKAR